MSSVKWRPKNFFELASLFRDYGVGMKFYRKTWKYEEPCYYVVKKIKITRNDDDMIRGKAWGDLVWRGKEVSQGVRIRSPYKREWKYLQV